MNSDIEAGFNSVLSGLETMSDAVKAVEARTAKLEQAHAMETFTTLLNTVAQLRAEVETIRLALAGQQSTATMFHEWPAAMRAMQEAVNRLERESRQRDQVKADVERGKGYPVVIDEYDRGTAECPHCGEHFLIRTV